MVTEFTCGIYTAILTDSSWYIKTNGHMIGIVELHGVTHPDGILIRFVSACPFLSTCDLIEIAVLMNNIKRQYKQLQTT